MPNNRVEKLRRVRSANSILQEGSWESIYFEFPTHKVSPIALVLITLIEMEPVTPNSKLMTTNGKLGEASERRLLKQSKSLEELDQFELFILHLKRFAANYKC